MSYAAWDIDSLHGDEEYFDEDDITVESNEETLARIQQERDEVKSCRQ